MKQEEKPPTGATVNGLNTESPDKQLTNDANYTVYVQPSQEQVSQAISLLAQNWPKQSNPFQTEHLKTATSLASGLLRAGWQEKETQKFIESVIKTAGGNLKIVQKATSYAADRLKKGEPVSGWPTLVDLTSKETVDKLRELLSLNNNNKKPIAGFEILDNPPIVLRKPLQLIEGIAYAATWLYVQLTLAETTDKDGKITRHNPPLKVKERRLMIIREDGTIFNNEKLPLSDLGFEVSLFEIPQLEKLWSSKGFQSYTNGERANAESLFKKLCDVTDTFIDFDRSTASQEVMCEFISCYILATWFLDAFNVIGFLWPNGERGSGKTQLLTLISQLGYLGQFLTSGSSYASLRDLADYGATLCFDDAENISDPRKQDGDKRALLLAGNKKGSSTTLKVPDSNNKWRTKHVNTYCARVFSAIALPDSVLASRTIIVPLIRTADKAKANNDPQDFKLWPHDYRKLVDDLWSLALANLQRLSAYENKASESSSLKGRALEQWKAVLAVALWLEDQGIKGLWERIDKLSSSYQNERQDFEREDITTLIIRSLCKCLNCEVVKLCEVSEVDLETTNEFVLTRTIETEAINIIIDRDLDIDHEEVSSRKIGKKLAQLRLRQGREGGTGRYGWYVSQKELAYWVKALGITDVKDDS